MNTYKVGDRVHNTKLLMTRNDTGTVTEILDPKDPHATEGRTIRVRWDITPDWYFLYNPNDLTPA
jgi:hypothetical protein